MSNDIKLIVTVRGPNPWSKPGGGLVSGLLDEIGREAEQKLSHLHSKDKPKEWQAVEVFFEIKK